MLKRHIFVTSFTAVLLTAAPATTVAQVTRADSAHILLDVARSAHLAGEHDLVRSLLRYLLRAYGDTPAARESQAWYGDLRSVESSRSGRVGLTVWNTLYGAWLGIAIPAAFGANEPEPYGAGLLIGAPAAFLATRAVTSRYGMTSGQALATAFGTLWGTYQAAGWRAALDIGTSTQRFCYGPEQQLCDTYESDPAEATFTAAVIGGLSGLAASGAFALAKNPTAGAATLTQFGALWGTWYGAAAMVLADVEGDDSQLAWVLVGGDLGLLAAAIGSRYWDVSAGRAWLISASGVAGLVAGFGLDLLGNVDSAQEAVLIPAATSLMGLAAGALMTRNMDVDRFGSVGMNDSGALLHLENSRPRIGLPLPIPTAHQAGPGKTRMGIRIPLFTSSF
jgi:hypothetical protein